MSLIDQIFHLCKNKMVGQGWDLLLKGHGLDIDQPTPAKLAAELARPGLAIDRTLQGFEDFAGAGDKGIEFGSPARSLLFHALASPNVLNGIDGVRLPFFPTLADLEIVETYVFGVQPPSLADLRKKAPPGSKWAVVVFAFEYRPAKDTCSGRQADLAFSRTGIARVGTSPPRYDAARRGFWPEVDENPFGIRVCPARYGAFLAVSKKGDKNEGVPMRHQNPRPGTNPRGDDKLDFWVPVHKLFSGPECLKGRNLEVSFTAFHVNEKVRRVRVSLGELNPPTTKPYRFSDGIAEISTDPNHGGGVVIPIPHARLVEPAVAPDGKFVTFAMPKNNQSAFAAYEPDTDEDDFGEIRPAPAYVNARTEVRTAEVLIDLSNDPARPDVLKTVRAGNYKALHYLDFTGEGQIEVKCEGFHANDGIAAEGRPAYSLVSAPDFFPTAGQRELTEWTASNAVPTALRKDLWGVPPDTLCDVRLPANLQLPGLVFDASEITVTAVVPLLGSAPAIGQESVSKDAIRHSCLPDDAAGTFAPGWDVSHDVLKKGSKKIPHLAAYGLGSPFPEDAKLCAALSTYWPTVAPDVARSMSPSTGNSDLRGTVVPLTDEEIGQTGSLPWDGVVGPRLVTINGQRFAECASFLHVDYVQNALGNLFSVRLTAQVSVEEYERRVLAMAFVYRSLSGNLSTKTVRNHWLVFSFRSVAAGDGELQKAQFEAATVLAGTVFRVELFGADLVRDPSIPSATDFRKRLLPVTDRRFFFSAPDSRIVLQRREDQPTWSRAPLNV